MSDENQLDYDNLEAEFAQELKGEGSLAINLVSDQSVADGEPVTKESRLAYEIRPENLEALYFEALQVPRWESLEAENNEKKIELYWKLFNEKLAGYPQLDRIRDTDEKVKYSEAETEQLGEELARLESQTTAPEAAKAIQKFSLACHRAAEKNTGLIFVPTT